MPRRKKDEGDPLVVAVAAYQSWKYVAGRLAEEQIRMERAIQRLTREDLNEYLGAVAFSDVTTSKKWGRNPSVEKPEGGDE